MTVVLVQSRIENNRVRIVAVDGPFDNIAAAMEYAVGAETIFLPMILEGYVRINDTFYEAIQIDSPVVYVKALKEAKRK